MIDVDDEADLLAVEAFRAVDVGDRDDHHFQLVVHDVLLRARVAQPTGASLAMSSSRR